jgi:hypothetical protein
VLSRLKPSCLRIAIPAVILSTLSLALPASAVPATTTYFAANVHCDTATFKLAGLKPAAVRAARVTLGRRKARVKPAVVRRAARRHILRLRLSTLRWTRLRTRTHTRRIAKRRHDPRSAERTLTRGREKRARRRKRTGCRSARARQARVRRKRPKLIVITFDRPNPTDPAPPAGTPVSRRICMNVHMNYGRPYDNVAQTKRDLDYLGVDCVRDWLPSDWNFDAQPERWNQLDVDVIAYCGGYFSTWWWEGNESTCVRGLKQKVPRAVAVEGMNEPYCGNFDALKANISRLEAHMTRIRDAAQQVGLDAYTVSLCNPDAWLSSGGHITPGMVNNEHSYSPPCAWPNESLSTFQLGWYKQFPIAGSGRWATTEAGRQLGCFPDQTTHAQVQLVHMLYYLKNGWERAAMYQLYDEGPDPGGYGYWANDHTRRQAAEATHNLMAHLGETVTVGNFGYTVSDPAGLVQHTAFVDGAGRHYVALWNGAQTGARSVTLTLPEAHRVAVVDPIVSDQADLSASSSTHMLSMGNDPLIVRVD